MTPATNGLHLTLPLSLRSVSAEENTPPHARDSAGEGKPIKEQGTAELNAG